METVLQAGPYLVSLRILTMDDKRNILELQKTVQHSLENPTRLQALTEEELDVIISQGLFLGAFENEQLIAARALLVPPVDEEHLGKDAGIPKDEWNLVIYQEISLVAPSHQGHGVQQKLGKWWMTWLEGSDYRYICATVAPFNIPSMKDKFALGLTIAALKEKYDGKLRYVFVKEIGGKVEMEDTILVEMNDLEKQQQLLVKGYRGINMEFKRGQWYVEYTCMG